MRFRSRAFFVCCNYIARYKRTLAPEWVLRNGTVTQTHTTTGTAHELGIENIAELVSKNNGFASHFIGN